MNGLKLRGTTHSYSIFFKYKKAAHEMSGMYCRGGDEQQRSHWCPYVSFTLKKYPEIVCLYDIAIVFASSASKVASIVFPFFVSVSIVSDVVNFHVPLVVIVGSDVLHFVPPSFVSNVSSARKTLRLSFSHADMVA